MTDKTINCAIQIVPIGVAKEEAYRIIDQALAVIQQSGIRHQITPFETVLQGSYRQVTQTILLAQEAALQAGHELLIYTKLHISPDQDITFEEKRLDEKRS